MDRSSYREAAGDYLPGDYNKYISGTDSSAPDPNRDMSRQLARLYKLDDFNLLTTEIGLKPRSEVFERFMALQNSPGALFESKVKLPGGAFGPAQFM